MAEVDAQAYAVTSGNIAAGASNSIETQQPGATGALRQVVVQGDATTRANLATVNSDGTANITPGASASAAGAATYTNTALSSTKQAVNAAAGNLYGYHIYNPNSVVVYVQLFNLASASVTVGSTAPAPVLAIPAGGWADATTSGPPISFSTALTIAATTTATGSTAPTTALLCNMWYK